MLHLVARVTLGDFKKIFILTALILFLSSCDFDKFLGYSNEAEDLLKYVKITGNVTNFYTGKPASVIHVNVRQYETLTDYTGNYNFTYILTADDERNRPIVFKFSHEKYYPLEKSVLIDPLGMEVNVAMHYAAPVIEKTALFWKNDPAREGNYLICQAIILDYQGINTLSKVEATLQLENAACTITWEESFLMSMVDNPTMNKGYFQAEILLQPGAHLKNGYRVYALDNEGYEETYKTSINPSQPDDPIF